MRHPVVVAGCLFASWLGAVTLTADVVYVPDTLDELVSRARVIAVATFVRPADVRLIDAPIGKQPDPPVKIPAVGHVFRVDRVLSQRPRVDLKLEEIVVDDVVLSNVTERQLESRRSLLKPGDELVLVLVTMAQTDRFVMAPWALQLRRTRGDFVDGVVPGTVRMFLEKSVPMESVDGQPLARWDDVIAEVQASAARQSLAPVAMK